MVKLKSFPEHIDLNLLRTLVVIIEERSTIAAAKRLHLAQSTISGSLKQLRDLFQDELLVRRGNVLEPTSLALEILESAKPALEVLTTISNAAIPFDPANNARLFRFGCTDAVALSILPKLTKELRAQSPACDLLVRIGDYRVLPEMLEQDEIQCALGYFGQVQVVNAKIKVLRNSQLLVVRDKNSKPVETIGEFAARPHALVTPKGDLKGFVDIALAKQGKSRRVVIGISNFATLLSVLPDSDMISTVPDFVGTKLLALGNLAIDPLPFAMKPVANALVWRVTVDRDPAEIWFRNLVTSIFKL
jgi:LysR family transcriptional regulator, mexEF-oprN operon transcriptional activator